VAHTLDEMTTGRTGEEHRLFVQVVNELRSHKPTSQLAEMLVQAADTPDMRNLPSWRLFVAARVVQQPNKGKEWPLFRSIALSCKMSEYEKLCKRPDNSSPKPERIKYFTAPKGYTFGPPKEQP
jgi:hypothetical protein